MVMGGVAGGAVGVGAGITVLSFNSNVEASAAGAVLSWATVRVTGSALTLPRVIVRPDTAPVTVLVAETMSMPSMLASAFCAACLRALVLTPVARS